MPADRIVASVRDPAKATELAKKGVHVSVDKLGETAL